MTKRMWIHLGYAGLVTITMVAAFFLFRSELDAKMKTCFLIFLVFTFAGTADRLVGETRSKTK